MKKIVSVIDNPLTFVLPGVLHFLQQLGDISDHSRALSNFGTFLSGTIPLSESVKFSELDPADVGIIAVDSPYGHVADGKALVMDGQVSQTNFDGRQLNDAIVADKSGRWGMITRAHQKFPLCLPKGLDIKLSQLLLFCDTVVREAEIKDPESLVFTFYTGSLQEPGVELVQQKGQIFKPEAQEGGDSKDVTAEGVKLSLSRVVLEMADTPATLMSVVSHKQHEALTSNGGNNIEHSEWNIHTHFRCFLGEDAIVEGADVRPDGSQNPFTFGAPQGKLNIHATTDATFRTTGEPIFMCVSRIGEETEITV